MGEQAQKAWAEVKKSWEMALMVEMEGLKLASAEAEKDYELIQEKLRQADRLFKKRTDGSRRYLHHLKQRE